MGPLDHVGTMNWICVMFDAVTPGGNGEMYQAFASDTFAGAPTGGVSGQVLLTVSNLGGADVSGPVSIRLWLNRGDQYVFLQNYSIQLTLPQGQSDTVALAVTVPADTPAGTYSWLAEIDPDNAIADMNRANNVVLSDWTIEV